MHQQSKSTGLGPLVFYGQCKVINCFHEFNIFNTFFKMFVIYILISDQHEFVQCYLVLVVILICEVMMFYEQSALADVVNVNVQEI